MRHLWLIAIFVTGTAQANKPVVEPVAPALEQSQTQGQSQSATAGQSQGQTAHNEGVTAANVISSSTRAIGLSTTAPAPLHDTAACYLPAKGIRRTRSVAFGLWQADPRLVRDPECMQDVREAREHELAMLRAQAELLRLENERERRACEACEVGK